MRVSVDQEEYEYEMQLSRMRIDSVRLNKSRGKQENQELKKNRNNACGKSITGNSLLRGRSEKKSKIGATPVNCKK